MSLLLSTSADHFQYNLRLRLVSNSIFFADRSWEITSLKAVYDGDCIFPALLQASIMTPLQDWPIQREYDPKNMTFRRLGPSGLRVPVFSLGGCK